MTCQHTMTLGVYLLGALDPSERSAFESHLSYCEICRGELVRLAPLPGLLNQISLGDFSDELPSTAVEGAAVVTRAQPLQIPVQLPAPEVVAEPEPQPRPASKRTRRKSRPEQRPGNEWGPGHERPGTRRYWRVASAAAAVVVLAAAAIFGWRAMREEDTIPPAAGVTWTAAVGSTSVEARLVDHEWGTEIQSKIHGLPPGRKCYLFVYDHYGNREVAGWWGTDHDPNEEIPASTSIMRSKIDRLVYMLDDKETVAFTIEAPS